MLFWGGGGTRERREEAAPERGLTEEEEAEEMDSGRGGFLMYPDLDLTPARPGSCGQGVRMSARGGWEMGVRRGQRLLVRASARGRPARVGAWACGRAVGCVCGAHDPRCLC